MEVIKDYSDLSTVNLDKLYKLRDVAKDNMAELMVEAELARQRFIDIQLEITRRNLST